MAAAQLSPQSAIQNQQILFVKTLFSNYLSRIEPSFANALGASWLLYFQSTYDLAPDHVLHCFMLDTMAMVFSHNNDAQNVSTLLEWSSSCRTQFVSSNVLLLPTNIVRSNTTTLSPLVDPHTVQDSVDALAASLQFVMFELSDLKNSVISLADVPRQVNRKRTRAHRWRQLQRKAKRLLGLDHWLLSLVYRWQL